MTALDHDDSWDREQPWPQPDPPGMDGLFERPSPERRILAGNPSEINGRKVSTLIPSATLL